MKRSEKEKSALGLLYNANLDPDLLKERTVCKDLCYQYNQTKYADLKKRNELMRRILGHTKSNFLIEQPFWSDYGYNIEIGEGFYSNHNMVILDGATVKFGDHVFIGPNCGFYTAGHPENVAQRIDGLEYARPISVGNNVWIGGNVVVLPGVSIGDNSIIGAGSVVTKDIPANVVAAGNPCKVIRPTKNE